MLGKELSIKNITHDARLEQLSQRDKYGVLDLDVELESGEVVNVEIQLNNLYNIEKRTTFYAAKKVVASLGPKDTYKQLKKVIVIAILDYTLTDLPEYITKTVRVADKHREYEINNNVEYYYVELEKFRKQNPDMEEPLNQWLAFLDMERGDLLEMAKEKNEIIKQAKEYYDVLIGDEEVKRLAEVEFLAKLEENTALENAEERGKKERRKI
jgi:predicted transposase/invertase (TIGR01784 family)